MADIPNIPKEVIEKLPTADQWKKNGSSMVTYSFMVLFIFYFLWNEFIKQDSCGEKIASFEKVIIQKDNMIESLNQRVSKLENALDVKNGVIKSVEERVSDAQSAGGSK